MDLQGLEALLEAADYYEYDIEIQQLDRTSRTLKLLLDVRDTESHGKMQMDLLAEDCIRFVIDQVDYVSHVNIVEEHALLWAYNDIQCELYVSGIPTNWEKTVYNLLQIQRNLYGKFMPFDEDGLFALQSGLGLFKKGSQRLLHIYAEVLKKNGVGTSIIGGYDPLAGKHPYKVLFLGSSYVIARNFSFTQVLATILPD